MTLSLIKELFCGFPYLPVVKYMASRHALPFRPANNYRILLNFCNLNIFAVFSAFFLQIFNLKYFHIYLHCLNLDEIFFYMCIKINTEVSYIQLGLEFIIGKSVFKKKYLFHLRQIKEIFFEAPSPPIRPLFCARLY